MPSAGGAKPPAVRLYMRFIFKNPPPPGNDWERQIGLFILPIIIFTALIAAVSSNKLIPPCFFHELTGYPCPTCGSLRCARLLLHGRFLAAFLMQPLAAVILVGAFLYMLYALAAVTLHLPRLRVTEVTLPEKLAIVLGILGAVLLNWGYLIATGK